MITARPDAFAALSASITATIAAHVSGVMVRVTASKARGLFVFAEGAAADLESLRAFIAANLAEKLTLSEMNPADEDGGACDIYTVA